MQSRPYGTLVVARCATGAALRSGREAHAPAVRRPALCASRMSTSLGLASTMRLKNEKSPNLRALHATIQPTRPGYRNAILPSICDISQHLHLRNVALGTQIALRNPMCSESATQIRIKFTQHLLCFAHVSRCFARVSRTFRGTFRTFRACFADVSQKFAALTRRESV